MAVIYKSSDEIELLRQSNELVSKTHAEIAKIIEPGIELLRLDRLAEEFIRDNNAEPAFLGYRNFPSTLCISKNSVVVHGIPSKDIVEDGDIVSIDCGVLLNGYYGDAAYTYPLGKVSNEVRNLLTVTKEALYKGIENAVVGKRLEDIGFAIQTHVRKFGYSVVRKLVGHGVGRSLHEDPKVTNYGKRGKGMKLREGLVLAIEPMINMGSQEVRELADGWSIVTADGKPSAHYEHSVVVGKGKADILSTFDHIEKALESKL